ncbi:MAG: type II secretion system protein [Lentisphaeria bacterium]|nr:type II secretion system protein [Lentisphaeria bacterium]
MTARKRQPSPSPRRFTLVELIAGLIVLAVAAAIFAPFLQGILQKTVAAPEPVQQANLLLTVMERISDDYDRDPTLRADLTLFRSKILQSPSPYGTDFSVLECSYVRFQNGQEVAGDENDSLKVAIANSGNVLIGIFPKGATE